MSNRVNRILYSLWFVVVGTSFVFLATGCGPTRGYEGPERPPEQISQIRFASQSNFKVKKRMVNGKSASSAGIDMLPGAFNYNLTGRVEGPRDRCAAQKRFNYSGYRDCQQKNAYCDCYKYMSVYQVCRFPVWPSDCSGKLKGRAGREYEISVFVKGKRVRVHAKDRNSGKLQWGQCLVQDPQWKEDGKTIRVGSISNAIKLGVGSCP